MSSQRGNIQKSRAQKYQNKSAFKNVYHDTSKRTQQIVNTVVSGVCARCKDCIDWKIKYKKYKPLTQPKTCVLCKQKTVKQAYHTYCNKCSADTNKCAKCGEKKDVVIKPKLSEAEQAAEDREFQFELEQLPERKRRTFLRLQEKGKLGEDGTNFDYQSDGSDDSCDNDDDDDDELKDLPEMNTVESEKQLAAGVVRNESDDTEREINDEVIDTQNDNRPTIAKGVDISKLEISGPNEDV